MTTLKTLVIAAALVAAPSLSFAACGHGKQQAQNCIEGTTWDSGSQSCVPISTS